MNAKAKAFYQTFEIVRTTQDGELIVVIRSFDELLEADGDIWWSLYGRTADGEAHWISDHRDFAQAARRYQDLTGKRITDPTPRDLINLPR